MGPTHLPRSVLELRVGADQARELISHPEDGPQPPQWRFGWLQSRGLLLTPTGISERPRCLPHGRQLEQPGYFRSGGIDARPRLGQQTIPAFKW